MAAELDALQPDTFSLMTLSFPGIGSGNSPLDYGVIDISDALGATIIPAGLEVVTIREVPVPAALLLFLSGLGGLIAWGRRIGAARQQQVN